MVDWGRRRVAGATAKIRERAFDGNCLSVKFTNKGSHAISGYALFVLPGAEDDEYLHVSTGGGDASMMQPVLCRREVAPLPCRVDWSRSPEQCRHCSASDRP